MLGSLSSRGGAVSGMTSHGTAQVIDVTVPLRAMFGYANELRSLTQGRATYTMEFAQFAPLPDAVAKTMVT